MTKANWGFRIVLFLGLLYIASGSHAQWELDNLSKIAINMDGPPVIYGGENFANEFAAKVAVAEQQRDTLYRWAVFLNPWQAIGLLTATCGGCGGFLREVLVSVQYPEQKRLNWMYLGILIGPAILLGVLGIGEILFDSKELKIWSVVTLTFLGGCFAEESFDFLQQSYAQMRKKILK